MSTPQEKFLAALNLAMHPTTIDGDIVAGIRGASRLLGGKTLKEFLSLPDSEQVAELREALAIAEGKLEGAVEYCNELKLKLQRLQEEFAQAKAEATPKPPTPKITKHFTKSELAWRSCAAFIILGLLTVILFLRPSPATLPMAKPEDSSTIMTPWHSSIPDDVGISTTMANDPLSPVPNHIGEKKPLCFLPRHMTRDGCQ
jgi:hypothetical protein